ncbi:MAG: NAD(P)/FAD-dependent oxidoreductase [Chloroflexota bacterium]|nr:NAD(P)/FAD-dependent oxidoreductase [Chloroflexota bacterium]
MTSNQYDAIVVGSGGGGLGASIAFAKAGMKTLLLEKHHAGGGYITSFKRKGFCFDPGATVLFSGTLIGMPLDMVGLRQDVDLDLLKLKGSAMTFHCPKGNIGFAEGMTTTQMVEQLWDMKSDDVPRVQKMLDVAMTLATDERMQNRSLADWFKENSVDPSLMWLFGMLSWFLLVLPPSKAPASMGGTLAFMPSMEQCYPRGGILSIARAYVKALELLGGELRTKAPVAKILKRGDKVEGVELENGEKISSEIVVSDVGIDNTVTKLVGANHFDKELVEKVTTNLKPTLSCFGVFLGLDYVPDIAPGTISVASSDTDHIEKVFTDLESGGFYERQDAPMPIYMHVPSLEDPDLAPPGQSAMSILVWAPYKLAEGNWKEKKEFYTDVIVKATEERLVPRLSEHIIVREAATPLTYERYTGKRGGAILGQELGVGTVPIEGDALPIEGLYCVGDTVGGAAGMVGTLVTGYRRALQIIDPDATKLQPKFGVFGL